MENLVIGPDFWSGKRVFVTGNTGFKGGWMSLWLKKLGAEVSGYGLAPVTDPSLFDLLKIGETVPTTIADINDRAALDAHLKAHKPEIIFHLAAQPLVRLSYRTPVETMATNIIGTANLLDAVRACPSVKAVVIITSDKCYENKEWVWGYRESEPMGGHDPYSVSKGCAELVTSAMRRSYFTPGVANAHGARVASVRAGNVIGGGDWSEDRLIPDIIRGALGPGSVTIRNPKATRPWQHVLEPLGGYLRVAQKLVEAPEGGFDTGWNFGPHPGDIRPVLDVAQAMVRALGTGKLEIGHEANAVHEATLLQLDIAKARAYLGWEPALTFSDTVAMTADWYAAWHQRADLAAFTDAQIEDYMKKTNA